MGTSFSTLRPSMTELEPRILYSASPLGDFAVEPAIADQDSETIDLHQIDYLLSEEANDVDLSFSDVWQFSDSTLNEPSVLTEIGSPTQTEIVFLDSQVDDFDLLFDELSNEAATNHNFELVVLRSDRDGVQQISDALLTRTNVSAIHVVSHGSDGAVQLGNSVLNNQSLTSQALEISNWSDALATNADVLFYGCDLASSDAGQEFVESIAALTGADVAASDDKTGNSELGGDWEFEFVTGLVESDIVFSAYVQEEWHSVLASVTVTQSTDVINGDTAGIAQLIANDGGDGISLREAMIAANANIDSDTILLGSQTYQIQLVAYGDFDVTSTIDIVGLSNGSSIIDGNGMSRVFDVQGGTLSISNTTITGGAGTDGLGGGGILLQSGSLVLDNVIVTGNTSTTEGAGISAHDNLTISNSTISNNRALGTADGGGIALRGLSNLSNTTISGNLAEEGGGVQVVSGIHDFTNVTISSNDASKDGGGWSNLSGIASFNNGTITNNSSSSGAGGVFASGGTFDTANSIIAGNQGGTYSEIEGTIFSSGFNIIGDDLGDSLGGTGYVDSDLLDQTGLSLGALADNGGPVATHQLLAGSTGIGLADASTATATDARGVTRDATPDIGAYEAAVANSAPSHADGTLLTITEDTLNPAGDSIFNLFNPSFSDPNSGDTLSGVAITANTVPAASGLWQFSTDNGLTWRSIGVVDESNALLLDVNALVRFLPGPDFAGDATISTRAIDSSYTGSFSDDANRLVADASINGGVHPFSASVGNVLQSVTGVNDEPVVISGSVSNLTIDEDSGFTPLNLIDLTHGAGGGVDEVSQTIIYQVTVIPSPSFGTIYLDDGTTAVTTGTYLLSEIQGMQIETTANESGGISFFEFQVIDDGGTADGGDDRITHSIRIDVSPINDAPEFEHGFATQDATFSGDYIEVLTGRGAVQGDNLLAIGDTNQTYELSALAFTGDGMGGGTASNTFHYLGFSSFDIDGNFIHPYHVLKHAGAVDTTLAVDLNPGDTEIVLTDATGWFDEVSNPLYDYIRRSISWYGYQDSTGHVYDDYTYTRNYSADIWDTDAISGNTITLRDPWAGPALSAGDAVRNTTSGGTYSYAMLSGGTIPETLTEFSATIGGGESTDGASSTTLFRPGTAFIKALVLSNYTPLGDPIDTDSILTVDNFEIRATSGPYVNGVTTFTEGGPAIDILDVNARIHDVDDTNIESVTVTLSNGKIGDLLQVDVAAINAMGVNVSGVDSNPLAADGTITLTLNANSPDTISSSDFILALGNIQFENVSDNPDTTDRLLNFIANDGELDSEVSSLALRIVPIVDAPVWSNFGGDVGYAENDNGVFIQPTLTVNDIDSPDFFSGKLTVSFAANQTENDWLRIVPDGNITLSGLDVLHGGVVIGQYSGGHSGSDLVITLNTNAGEANVSELAQRIAYANTSENPSELARTIQFRMTDGDGGTTGVAQNLVTPIAVQDAPIARDDIGALDFDGVDDYVTIADHPDLTMTTAVTMEAWINPDTYPSISFSMIMNKEREYEVAISPTGEISWAFANTVPGWTWQSTGFKVPTGEWTHVAVTYDNGTISTFANGQLVDVYYGSGDIGDLAPTLNELRIGGRTAGAATHHFDGQIDEVRLWNVARTESEILSTLDTTVASNAAGLVGYWQFDENTGNVANDLTNPNNWGTLVGGADGPQWTGYVTNANSTFDLSGPDGILSNDVNFDLESTSVFSIDQTSTLGIITDDGSGNLTYDPNGAFDYLAEGEVAVDSFDYTIQDINGAQDTATVVIRINGMNEAPLITSNSLNIDENQTNVGNVVASDIDTNDTLTYSLTGTGVDDASFSIDSVTGELTILAAPDFEAPADSDNDGVYQIEVRVSDGIENVTRLISVTVNDVNEIPTVSLANLISTLPENADTTVPIKIADIVVTDDALGVANLSLSGTDAADFQIVGTELFLRAGTPLDFESNSLLDVVVEVDDPAIGGTPDDFQSHSLTISDVNEAPVANADNFVGTEDSTMSGDVTINDTDVENNSLNAILVSGPANAAGFTLNSDGTFTYLPVADFNGSDSFQYRVNDGLADSNVATVTLSIAPVNDKPNSGADNYSSLGNELEVTIGESVLGNDSDIDGDTLSAKLISGPANGIVTLNADGSFRYLADSTFVGFDSFTYAANDGTESGTATQVTIEVIGGVVPVDPVDPTDPSDPDPKDPVDPTDGDDPDPVTPDTSNKNPSFIGYYDRGADDRPSRGESEDFESLESILAARLNNNSLPNRQQAFDVLDWMMAERDQRKSTQTDDELANLPGMSFGFDANALWNQMDELEEKLTDNRSSSNFTFTTTIAVTTITATAGYVIWSLRGGFLMATLVSSLPMWSHIDPLPILDRAPNGRLRVSPELGDQLFD